MKKTVCIILSMSLVCGLVAFAIADTSDWIAYAENIEETAADIIHEVLTAYKNDGYLEHSSVEMLYRFYRLWNIALELKTYSAVGFISMTENKTGDPYA